MVKTRKQYDHILVNQYPLVYFLMSEENGELLEMLLKNPDLKDHIVNQVDQKIQVNAMNFAVLNGLESMVKLLQIHGR